MQVKHEIEEIRDYAESHSEKGPKRTILVVGVVLLTINVPFGIGSAALAGIIGVAVAYVVEAQPSATMLLGKSPEYVAAYTDGYRMTSKSVQTGKAWTGCIIGSLVSIGLVVLAEIADETN